MAIPEKDYLACFEDWKIRWYKCISSRGDYFEGDKIDLQEEIKIFHFTNKFTYFLPTLVYIYIMGSCLFRPIIYTLPKITPLFSILKRKF